MEDNPEYETIESVKKFEEFRKKVLITFEQNKKDYIIDENYIKDKRNFINAFEIFRKKLYVVANF